MFGAPEIKFTPLLKKSLTFIKNELYGAILYLDKWTTQCIQCTVGLKPLFELGILNVHSLEKPSINDALVAKLLQSVKEDDKKTPKVVVFLNQLLYDAIDEIQHLIQMHPLTRQLLIFCGYSADAHAQLSKQSFDQNAYTAFKTRLESLQSGIEVEIRYIPWMWVTITSESFILTPQFPPTLAYAFNYILFFRSSFLGFGLDADVGGSKEQEIKKLSQALVGFASHLGCKLDVFTLGPDSSAIGSEVIKIGSPVTLEGIPPEKTASLVLVDRSMDLLSPLLHPDSLMDRVHSILASKSSSTSPKIADLAVEVDVKTTIPLFGKDPEDLDAFYQHLLGRTAKDGSMYIRKWMREEFRSVGMKSEYKAKPGPPTSQELLNAVEALKKATKSAKNQSLQAVGTAVSEALNTDKIGTRWDALSASEKQILHTLESEDLVQYFLDLIQNISKPEAVFDITDLCSLLTSAYAFLEHGSKEPFNSTEEKLIVEALVQCSLSLKDTSFLDKNLFGEASFSRLKAELRSKLDIRLRTMKKLISSRSSFPELSRIIHEMSEQPIPLILALVSLILQNKRVPDLHHVTSTLQGLLQGATGGGGLLSKGLGRLGIGRSEEALGGHDLAIIFFVGGISLHEIQSIRKELESNGNTPWKTKILIGSTSLMSPENLTKIIWDKA